MTPPVITALCAGVLPLILVGLAMRVIRIRRGKRIGIACAAPPAEEAGNTITMGQHQRRLVLCV